MQTSTKQLTLKSLALFIGVIGLTLFVFSCAKGRSDGQARPNNSVNQNCVNCAGQTNDLNNGLTNGQAYGQAFFTSQSTDIMNRMNVNLSFMNSTGHQGYGSSPITSYSGLVYAQGQITITQALTSYGCVIPAGTYALQTTQPGQWSQAVLSGLVMQAIGPVSLLVHIPQAQVSARGGTGQTWNEVAPVGRLFGNINIQSMGQVQVPGTNPYGGASCRYSTLLQ